MSFLGRLFHSINQHQQNPKNENALPNKVKIIVLGQEANTFKTKFTKPGQFIIEMDSLEKVDELKQHLSTAGFLFICPNNLGELKAILDNLKPLLDDNQNRICRLVTNNPEIINAIENKSCLLYPPTEESSQTFYVKLKNTYLSQKGNEPYSPLSPLPTTLLSMVHHQSENDYPTLKDDPLQPKTNKPLAR
jgi:hypothetical protein